ncbi:MAG: DUF5050 domain-containing protein, partial [Oscillospiraceae bacterium]|nr:DUF5050 domain-containing protein [Oscillospiraceae bacterium]
VIGCSQPGAPVTPAAAAATSTPEPPAETAKAVPPADTELQYGNTASNLVNGGYVAEYGNYIFFADTYSVDHSAIFRLNTKTNEIVQLSDIAYGSLNVYNGKLYYSAHDVRDTAAKKAYGIYSCSFDGGDTTKIYEKMWLGFSIAGDNAYFAERHQAGPIFKLDLNTNNAVQLNDIQSADINVTESKIYYIKGIWLDLEDWKNHRMMGERENGPIYQMNLDGTENEVLFDEIVLNLVAEGDYLYYIIDDNGHYYLEQMDIQTGVRERLSDTEYANFNINGSRIYCCDAGRIDVLDLDGKLEKRYEIDGLTEDCYLQAAGDWIFFRQRDYWIYRINVKTNIIDVLYEKEGNSQQLSITPGQKLEVTQ